MHNFKAGKDHHHSINILQNYLQDLQQYLKDIPYLLTKISNAPIALLILKANDNLPEMLVMQEGFADDKAANEIAIIIDKFSPKKIMQPHAHINFFHSEKSGKYIRDILPDIQSCTIIPVIDNNSRPVATLCVMDFHPEYFSTEILAALKKISTQIINQIELLHQNYFLQQNIYQAEKERLALIEQKSCSARLLSIMAHDLRSPLNNLHALLSVMQIKMPEKNVLDILIEEMNREISGTHNLIDNLLQWAYAEFNGKDLAEKSFLLNTVFDEKIAQYKWMAEQKGIELINLLEQDIEITTNENIVRFLLRNLIGNAIKFTKNGFIMLNAAYENDHIKISIIDSGKGIPEEKKHLLFQWEENYTTSGTDGEKGSGLGLRICRDMVHRINGQIGFESKMGTGSTFYFMIPQKKRSNPQLLMVNEPAPDELLMSAN